MTMTTKPMFGGPAMAMAARNRQQNRPPGSAPAPMAPGATNAAPAQYPQQPPSPAGTMAPPQASVPQPAAVTGATPPPAAMSAPSGVQGNAMAMAMAARNRGGGGNDNQGGGNNGERGNPYEDWMRGWDPKNPKQWQKYMMRMNLRDYARAYGPLWEQINDLRNQANTDRFSDEERAQFLAPYMQNIEQQTGIAQSGLDQAMGERGLTDSSANALGQSNILARAAQARSGAVQDLFQSEEARKQLAQQQLMSQLQSISGRGMGGASDFANVISQLRQQAMLQQRAQPDSNIFGDLFGGLGGLVGMASGLGWRPLG